jgi:hypothetical protein
MAKKTLGKNIEYSVEGTKLTLVVDLSKDFGPSASGKTIIIASSEGNKDVGDVKVGLNIYKYPDAKPAKGKK